MHPHDTVWQPGWRGEVRNGEMRRPDFGQCAGLAVKLRPALARNGERCFTGPQGNIVAHLILVRLAIFY